VLTVIRGQFSYDLTQNMGYGKVCSGEELRPEALLDGGAFSFAQCWGQLDGVGVILTRKLTAN